MKNLENEFDKKFIDKLISSVEKKRLPTTIYIKEMNLIGNEKKYNKLKSLVIQQIKIFSKTKQKKHKIQKIDGKTEKIHPRSHVDGFDIVKVKSRDFKIVYEYWEMYFHKRPEIEKKDKFKQEICNLTDIVFIILTDEQDPTEYPQIIANQFFKQTGIKIKYQYQSILDLFIK